MDSWEPSTERSTASQRSPTFKSCLYARVAGMARSLFSCCVRKQGGGISSGFISRSWDIRSSGMTSTGSHSLTRYSLVALSGSCSRRATFESFTCVLQLILAQQVPSKVQWVDSKALSREEAQLLLWASRLSLRHPTTNEELEFESRAPPSFHEGDSK
mmetsp:Transcript_1612/g.4892  ORF Transcript_1612/g.4892 Transcript_1612/m.4892 type:complete len:158 (+) Transcript_1612:1886-2359(+)